MKQKLCFPKINTEITEEQMKRMIDIIVGDSGIIPEAERETIIFSKKTMLSLKKIINGMRRGKNKNG